VLEGGERRLEVVVVLAFHGALTLVAMSVHARCTPEIEERIELMHEVVRRTQTPRGVPLAVGVPGGLFGFDAETMSWPGVDLVRLKAMLPSIVQAHPVGAWLAFGVDTDVENQRAWLTRATLTISWSVLEADIA
jgi:hypothetical protein